jgi:hypothetical protein
MHVARWSCVAVFLWAAGVGLCWAGDLLPPETPIPEAIDHYIEAQLADEDITPAPPADEATLVRRLTLDLVGRIPTVAEVAAYVQSSDPHTKELLIDRLMHSPGYVRYQAVATDTMLMGEKRGRLREYLQAAIAENRRWDQVFRELIDADESDPQRKGAAEYLKAHLNEPDVLTNQVSVDFFGVNISCAQCHDHPLVDDWQQAHFFGMKSFFNRTFQSEGFVAESAFGEVKFQTTAGETREASPVFLTGTSIDEPVWENTEERQKAEKELFEKFKKEKKQPPPPEFSRRDQLADIALRPGEREFFARSIVNRMWHRFFGYGLVMPLDQMHSANPPTHPDLLDWLARDLVEHGYDLQRLARGLVQSDTYARSSQWEGEGDRPWPDLFAVAQVKPLAPEQYATSLNLAARDPEELNADVPAEELAERFEQMENRGRGLVDQFPLAGSDFQVSVTEGLLLSNNEKLAGDLLAEGGGTLVGRLVRIDDRRQRVEAAVWNTLCRPPAEEEAAVLVEYLAAREDRPLEACRQMVWALLTSSEMRFNH